ncbi:MAG: GAF domain-containing sensor histidine kinase [Actinobacteria bacterium]|nr:MAG: GAF domain-containing sensor histidine kinase [Actinomycetota bacterium]
MVRMSRLSERTADRLTVGLFASVVALGLAGTILTVVAWVDLKPEDAYPNLLSAFAGVVYALIGALIVRRARNTVGWALLGVGVGLAVLSFTSAYAVVGIASHPATLPAPSLVGALAEPDFAGTSTTLAFMLFVFPTGALPSRRWRPVVTLGLTAAGLTVLGFLFVPAKENLPAPGGISLTYANPVRVQAMGPALAAVLAGAAWVVALVTAAAFLSLVIRYRTGGSEQRQQIKWLGLAAASELLLLLAGFLALIACSCASSPIASSLLLMAAFVVLIGVPAALAIAILKYQLYEIDVIIKRAVVYGVLAAGVTVMYVGVVVGVGTLVGERGSPALTIAAAVAIALLFQPLRRRAQRFANRLVYGERATPYQVLSDFAERMAGTFNLEDVLQRMAAILAAGTGATRVNVWLRIGAQLRSAATWPAEAAPLQPVALADDGAVPSFPPTERIVAVRHGAELLGALAIQKPPSEPLTPTEETLLEDLAAQAGLVLRNVRLTADLQASLEDLRASRRRLVGAQDQERRKIERNLHDGAQQQLVALSVQVGLLERVAQDPDRVKEMADRLRGAVQDALDDLRDLARGIYPPLLADKGLAAALEAQARRAAVATTVHADGVGRYPQEVEAAVYFCALEALQNVAKYAEASSASVRLTQRDGDLMFEIEDDGRGFDATLTRRGTGLQGMADRLDAIGGTLTVRSTPGEGTLVTGSIGVGEAGHSD